MHDSEGSDIDFAFHATACLEANERGLGDTHCSQVVMAANIVLQLNKLCYTFLIHVLLQQLLN
jgi:hypothetical protein